MPHACAGMDDFGSPSGVTTIMHEQAKCWPIRHSINRTQDLDVVFRIAKSHLRKRSIFSEHIPPVYKATNRHGLVFTFACI